MRVDAVTSAGLNEDTRNKQGNIQLMEGDAEGLQIMRTPARNIAFLNEKHCPWTGTIWPAGKGSIPED